MVRIELLWSTNPEIESLGTRTGTGPCGLDRAPVVNISGHRKSGDQYYDRFLVPFIFVPDDWSRSHTQTTQCYAVFNGTLFGGI